MRTPLYLDFDDTLFENSSQFKTALFASLAHATHTTAEQVADAYGRIRGGLYSPEMHVAALGVPLSERSQDLTNALTELGPELPKLVPEAAKDFLAGIDREKYEPILLTYGDPAFQQWKVAQSGLLNEFSRTHFVTNRKADYLRDIVGHGADDTFILIDDSRQTLSEVSAAFPHAQTRESIVGAREWLNEHTQEINTEQHLPSLKLR